jgi:plastocyanin
MRLNKVLFAPVVLIVGIVAFGVSGFAVYAIAEAPRTINVVLKDDRLPPGAIHARPGDRIIFRNSDDHTHTANLEEPDHRFVDKEIEAGTSVMFIVPLTMPAGEYELNCTSHEGMKTTIVVETE